MIKDIANIILKRSVIKHDKITRTWTVVTGKEHRSLRIGGPSYELDEAIEEAIASIYAVWNRRKMERVGAWEHHMRNLITSLKP